MRRICSRLNWVVFVIGRRMKSRVLRLKRFFVRPSLPRNPGGEVFIHLGCGDVASPEFINVDARPAPHVHYVREVGDLSVFPENYADLVYACHVLEHIRHTTIERTLWEWRRVLKPGGVLRLSVPDFDKILCVYESCSRDIRSILCPLMGGQDYTYNVHYAVFNHAYLADVLREVGFRQIRSWEPASAAHHDFVDWADRRVSRNGTTFPVSLNLEAIK